MLRLISTGLMYNCKVCDDAIITHSDMPKLKSGDTISCRVKNATIVSPYRSYDEIKNFAIVAVDEYGYYLFVPHYYCLNGCIIADQYRCRTLEIDKKFINENVIYITENLVASVDSKRIGLTCKKCKEFFPWSESNQADDTLICFSCRGNLYK